MVDWLAGWAAWLLGQLMGVCSTDTSAWVMFIHQKTFARLAVDDIATRMASIRIQKVVI